VTNVQRQGHRWPAAHAESPPRPLVVGGTASRFVVITVSGEGRAWSPEPVDATWRDLAELDLADPIACQAFARRRGDPSGVLSPTSPIVTHQWSALATGLQRAATAWSRPDDDGVSSVILDRAARAALAAQLFEQITLAAPWIGLDGDFGWSLNTDRFDNFLICSAAQALERALPMRRCTVCGSWFEIRRPNRSPRFCSASCRALHHQHPESSHHGISTQKPDAQGHDSLAGDLERTRARRQDAPADEELHPAKRSTRPRRPHGAGSRAPRRRRSAKA